jgi:hypothetical protein
LPLGDLLGEIAKLFVEAVVQATAEWAWLQKPWGQAGCVIILALLLGGIGYAFWSNTS